MSSPNNVTGMARGLDAVRRLAVRPVALPRPAVRRRPVLSAAILLGLLLWLAAGAGIASAHATLVATDPPDGTTLGSAPSRLRLVFSEPVAVDLVTVSLVDDGGVALDGVTVVADPADAAAVFVQIPAVGTGAYRLAWKAVDDQDLHVTKGLLVFGISAPAAAPATAAVAAPGLLEVLLRWLDLVALSLVAGSAAVLAVAVPRVAPADRGPIAMARRWLGRLGLVAGAGALATGVGLLLVQADAAGASVAAVLATGFGTSWLLRVAVLFAFLGLAMARRSGVARGPVGDAAALGIVGLLAWLQAGTGHAATGDAAGQGLRTIALALHVGAAWAWAGGVPALVVVALATRRQGPAGSAAARATFRRFWLVATPGLAVVAVSGLYLSGQLVATPAAMLGTLYGQSLLAKVALGGAAAVLGLLNAATLHPSLAGLLARRRVPVLPIARPAWLRRRLALEAAGALGVLLGAALLAASPPARGPAWEASPAAATQQPVTVRADDLIVTVTVRPNRPGPNFVDVTVYQTRKPAPAPVGEIAVSLAQGDGAASTGIAGAIDATRFELAGRTLQATGPVDIGIAIHRAGLPDARATVPWQVLPALPAVTGGPDGILATPLAPLTSTAALLLAIAIAGAVVAGRLRRRSAGAAASPNLPAASLAAVNPGGS